MTSGLQDTLVSGFTRLASDAPHRRIDAELRVLDIALATLFGLVALPFALVIALVVLVTSGRPILYRGDRVGRRGRFFQMLKFRTMKVGAEERIGQYLGTELIEATDAELTRIGRWLKASQLDEIPQLWNVLRGYETSMAEKLAHDLEWIADRSVRLYLRTIVVTGIRVLRQTLTRRT